MRHQRHLAQAQQQPQPPGKHSLKCCASSRHVTTPEIWQLLSAVYYVNGMSTRMEMNKTAHGR